MENENIFAKKVKDKGSWKDIGYSKENLKELAKPIRNHSVIYQQTKDDCGVAITTIEGK